MYLAYWRQFLHFADIARYSVPSPVFCMCVSASTHRRTNSSGVSRSGVGVDVGAEEVGTEGVGPAVEEASPLQPDTHSDAMHDSTSNRRVTTSCPPETR
jgi:hypothetical protein